MANRGNPDAAPYVLAATLSQALPALRVSELLKVTHEQDIHVGLVIGTEQEFAFLRNPRRYMIIDGTDTSRILNRYQPYPEVTWVAPVLAMLAAAHDPVVVRRVRAMRTLAPYCRSVFGKDQPFSPPGRFPDPRYSIPRCALRRTRPEFSVPSGAVS